MINDGGRITFRTEEEFQRVWTGEDPIPGDLPGSVNRSDAWFDTAGTYLSKRWLDEDIHLVRTGTVQLFQRRHDTLLEEIAFRTASGKQGIATIHLYLSHKGLADVRSRYWKLDNRAPLVVAEGNIGLLDETKFITAWKYGANLEELADYVERIALPWFDVFHEPVELHGLLRLNKVPLVNMDTALELVLAEYGRSQASNFLKHMLEMDDRLAFNVRQEILSIIRNAGSLGFGLNSTRNLAIIAHTYGLLKVRSV